MESNRNKDVFLDTHGVETIFFKRDIPESIERGELKKKKSKELLQSNSRNSNELPISKIFDVVRRLRVAISTPSKISSGDINDHLIINFGIAHAALVLFFQSWDENAQETFKVFQCVKKLEDVLLLLIENESNLMSDGNINRTSVKLHISMVDNVRNYMDMNEDIDPVHDFVKPALLTAAELGEYGLCSTIIQQNIPCHIFLTWHFSGQILAHLCLSRSVSVITEFVKSCPFPLDFAEALALAYEKQKVDIFEFILTLKIHPIEVKVKDFTLVIQQSVDKLDAAFLKYLHEKGMDAAKLIHPITANNVTAFLQACFALKFVKGHVFPFDRSSTLTVFVPACLEALIRHSKSPLTCVNSVLKTSPSNPMDTRPTPNLIYLFTEIMKDSRFDATIVKILMQLWHVTMLSAKRVEEEQEDLHAFCGKLETVVLEVFACDNTNVDVNLIPLVKMRHEKVNHKEEGRDDTNRASSGSTATGPITSTKDVHWIFGVHSIVRHAIDRNFKILFAVPQINRLIVHIFNSARQDFHHLYFKERFYPMILFYIQMFLRAIGFILLAKIVILDYADGSAGAFSFATQLNETSHQAHSFVPFSRWEIFLLIFIISEILEELGQLYEIQEGMSHHQGHVRSHTMDHVSTTGEAPSTSHSIFKDSTVYSFDDDADGNNESEEDDISLPDDISPIFIEHHGSSGTSAATNTAVSSGTGNSGKPLRTLYGSLYRQMSITAQPPDKRINNGSNDNNPNAIKHVSISMRSSKAFTKASEKEWSQLQAAYRPTSQKLHLNFCNPTISTSSSLPPLHRESSSLFTRSISRSLTSRVVTSDGESSEPNIDETSNSNSHKQSPSQSHHHPHHHRHKLLKRRKRHWAIIREYFSDEWNFLDVTNAGMGILWFVLRCIPSQASHARIVLSLLAIPWSLRMLRFLSINKTLGELVIIIKVMVMDVMAFLFVYVLMIVGFSVAFRGLFSDLISFHSNGDTFLSLFSGTMSNFGFEQFDSPSDVVNVIGIVLTILFVVMTAILLMNLLIARMSNSFQRISENSQMEWAFERARMVMSLTLIREKPVWNILPAPLNLIPIVLNGFGVLDFWIRQQAQLTEQATYFSIRGTVANITLFIVCFPFLKAIDVSLAFGQTFIWTKEEAMLPRSFAWLLLQAFVEVITYIPMFFVFFLVSLCRNYCNRTHEAKKKYLSPLPWMSYVHMKDGCIVLKSHEESPNESSPKMSMSKSYVDSKSLQNKKPSFGLFTSSGSKSFTLNNGMNDMYTSSSHVKLLPGSRDSKDKKNATLKTSSSALFRSMSFFSSFSSDTMASKEKDNHSNHSHIFGDQDIELILKSLRQKFAPLPKEEHLAQYHQLHQELRSLQQENRDIKHLLHVVIDQLRQSNTVSAEMAETTTAMPISPRAASFSMHSDTPDVSRNSKNIDEASIRSPLPSPSPSLSSPVKPLRTFLTGIPVMPDPIVEDDEKVNDDSRLYHRPLPTSPSRNRHHVSPENMLMLSGSFSLDSIKDEGQEMKAKENDSSDFIRSTSLLDNAHPLQRENMPQNSLDECHSSSIMNEENSSQSNTQPVPASSSISPGNVWWDPLNFSSSFS